MWTAKQKHPNSITKHYRAGFLLWGNKNLKLKQEKKSYVFTCREVEKLLKRKTQGSNRQLS